MIPRMNFRWNGITKRWVLYAGVACEQWTKERIAGQVWQPVEEMAPIVAKSPELRQLRPELAGQLDLYKANLGDLQTTLVQIRIMLLVRQASLEAERSQLCPISQWVTALRQTRSL